MTCEEAEVLIHALIDGELDAGHAREVEAHVEGCAHCAALMKEYQEIRQAIAESDVRYKAPLELRRKIEKALPQPQVAPSRRSVLRGFVLGSAVSALAATLLVAVVVRHDEGQMIESEIVSSHLRSLQPGHLIDVVSTDQHTVKPWFNGKLEFAPPVADFAREGFALAGGRLDYLDGHAVAALIYRQRQHVINLFIWPDAAAKDAAASLATRQGYHVARWYSGGMAYSAVSDLNPDDLNKFVAIVQSGAPR